MGNRNIIIPTVRDTYGYSRFCELVRPYLDVFGMPYEEIAPEALADRLESGCALILLAQSGLSLPDTAAEAIVSALDNGCGLVCLDDAALKNSAFARFCTYPDMQQMYGSDVITIADGSHYITALHTEGECIHLYSDTGFYINARLRGGKVLVRSGDALLEVAHTGHGKIALWHDIAWCSPDRLGPLHGMDDIVRRSIVWCAKKPFAMKGMPPFVGMRIDDVWGAWRDVSPKQPLLWIDIVNSFSFKPWLGLFQDNINDRIARLIRDYVKRGLASAFPHAFAGCEWVTSALPEHWLYFDHRAERAYSDDVMRENAARAKAWFDAKQIPISKVALAHYYEMGENAMQYLIDWGCEFIGVHMPPDAAYRAGSALFCGPYRKERTRASIDNRPVYYADYLSFPHNPSIDRKLFNCVTEIRDVRGYELAPTNDVANTIDSGVTQLRRAILSGIPATLFTHESCWIQRITPENWEAEIRGIASGIEDLHPIFDTLDNICRYVRANHNIRIEHANADELGNIGLTVGGVNDMPTKCCVYEEDANGVITKTWSGLPQAGGVMCPCNIY